MPGSRAVGSRLRGEHVLAWLEETGGLTAAQREGVVHHAERTGCRVEEALLDVGVLDEAALLKLLAARYGTRFVSTPRLAKAGVPLRALELVTRELAERFRVAPVVFDQRTQTLSVVAVAPGEDDLEKQLQVVTGVREVKAYVARPAAIDAAIDKFYRNDSTRFAKLLRSLDGPEIDLFDTAPRGGPSAAIARGAQDADPFNELMGETRRRQHNTPLSVPISQAPPPMPRARPAPPIELAPDGRIPGDFSFGESTPPGALDVDAYRETLNVFVALLERDRGELRGHSAQVCRICERVADRVGLDAEDRHALLVAAQLHDVGKMAGNYHLTMLNVARFEGHRTRAQRGYLAPVKLFASAALPARTGPILEHLYERFDGQGFPDRLAGKDIPFGARVLAAVETYCDLVGNAKNPYGRALTVPQALSVLRDLGGTLFDPTLAEVLVHLASSEQGDPTLTAQRRALVVDPDPEETTITELRLLDHGFAVSVARTCAAAQRELEKAPDVVISEVDLGDGPDGFALLLEVCKIEPARRPALLFVTSRADPNSVKRGFSLGAADYLVKPATPELIATKAVQAVEAAARNRASGVSGSLTQMSLPDVVQILANGRRSGRLIIRARGTQGEVHFGEGKIHDARFGDHASERAFYAMLRLTEGDFSFDPGFEPGERVIQTSPEGLLLEGMRRLDEGIE